MGDESAAPTSCPYQLFPKCRHICNDQFVGFGFALTLRSPASHQPSNPSAMQSPHRRSCAAPSPFCIEEGHPPSWEPVDSVRLAMHDYLLNSASPQISALKAVAFRRLATHVLLQRSLDHRGATAPASRWLFSCASPARSRQACRSPPPLSANLEHLVTAVPFHAALVGARSSRRSSSIAWS